jgi:hypothetical protein
MMTSPGFAGVVATPWNVPFLTAHEKSCRVATAYVTVQTAMVVDFAEGGGWALAGAGDGSEPQSVNS